jgi:hypothetical protein
LIGLLKTTHDVVAKVAERREKFWKQEKVRDIAGSIAMDEPDLIGDAEFYSTEFRLLDKQLAHVEAGADDAVIACPGTQHLPRTAAEVEHSGPPFQTQRRANSGELFGCDWSFHPNTATNSPSTFNSPTSSRSSTIGLYLGSVLSGFSVILA